MLDHFRDVNLSKLALPPALIEFRKNDPRITKFFPKSPEFDPYDKNHPDFRRFVLPIPDIQEINKLFDEVTHLIPLQWQYLNENIPAFLISNGTRSEISIESHGPFQPKVPPDFSLQSIPKSTITTQPFKTFVNCDFPNSFKSWIPFKNAIRKSRVKEAKFKSITSNIYIANQHAQVSLSLFRFKEGIVTPGYTINYNNQTYYSTECIKLIQNAVAVYPNEVLEKGKVSIEDFGDQYKSVMKFLPCTLR